MKATLSLLALTTLVLATPFAQAEITSARASIVQIEFNGPEAQHLVEALKAAGVTTSQYSGSNSQGAYVEDAGERFELNNLGFTTYGEAEKQRSRVTFQPYEGTESTLNPRIDLQSLENKIANQVVKAMTALKIQGISMMMGDFSAAMRGLNCRIKDHEAAKSECSAEIGFYLDVTKAVKESMKKP